MQVLNSDLIREKIVLLRLDIDVPLKNVSGKIVVADDFRLVHGMETLKYCLAHARSVIVLGHLGRPEGEDLSLSVAPVVDWLEHHLSNLVCPPHRLHVLENLRFEVGEDALDPNFAKELADMGDVFVNESFAAYHPSASTTLLPKLIPSAAGFKFADEIKVLSGILQTSVSPRITIMGGAKVADKLPVIMKMAQISDHVFVGGKLVAEIQQQKLVLPSNVILGELNPDGLDVTLESIKKFEDSIKSAKQIIWNGPMGKIEDGHIAGTLEIAHLITKATASGAQSILGGGDTVSAIRSSFKESDFSFVSTGGGAMLELLATGTLPSIEALN